VVPRVPGGRSLIRRFLVLLAIALSAAGQDCGYQPYCDGHNFTGPSAYPHAEDHRPGWVAVGPALTTLMTACPPLEGDLPGSPTRNEIRATAPVHVLLRAALRIDDLEDVPPGGRYSVHFLVDGIERGSAMRVLKALPQGDVFHAIALDVPAGNHYYEVKARTLDGGSFTAALVWTHAFGVPAVNPAGRGLREAPAEITGRWTEITDRLRISNKTGGNLDVLAQASLQFTGGTPGDRISVGFGLKPADDAVYPPSPRNSDFAVVERDGISIFDHKLSVGPGEWDLVLYAINRNGRTATAASRELAFAAIPAAAGVAAEYQNATPVVVDTRKGVVPHPVLNNVDPWEDCGKWTLLDEFQVPPSSGPDSVWTAQGYVEFLGRSGGEWDEPDVEVVFQLITNDPTPVTTEGGIHRLAIPRDLHGYSLFTDAGTWGNKRGNTIRVWARKRWGRNCGFRVGQIKRVDTGHATFRIGRRYFVFKQVPAGNCYNYNPYRPPAE
jgi:hypothetical protein